MLANGRRVGTTSTACATGEEDCEARISNLAEDELVDRCTYPPVGCGVEPNASSFEVMVGDRDIEDLFGDFDDDDGRKRVRVS